MFAREAKPEEAPKSHGHLYTSVSLWCSFALAFKSHSHN